jgi:small GTP-binding protein
MTQSELAYEILPENSSDYDLSFKLIVIGDSGVGKSCLTAKATKDDFYDFYNSTVGFEFCTFGIKINDEKIKLQIWDTCGQEAYKSLISSFYRNSALAVLCYSIDNLESFESLHTWLNEIKTQSNPDIKIFLIGNKIDLEDKRKVTKEMAEEFKNNNKINFFLETSAKTGFNAKNVFIEAAKQLYEEQKVYKERAKKLGNTEGMMFSNPTDNLKINEEELNLHRKSRCCF